MIFTCLIKPCARKSQFIKAGGGNKISNVWSGEERRSLVEEVICGLIILSKKVSVTYSKTAIPVNLCWRSLGPLERTEVPSSPLTHQPKTLPSPNALMWLELQT